MSKRFDILTIFPRMFLGPFGEGVVARAIEAEVLSLGVHDLREFAEGRHRKVDDEPFGGGCGMVYKPEPIFRAVESIRGSRAEGATRTILLSPQGDRFDQRRAERYAADGADLILICGRYEGVDERVREHLADEELSVGDFVLTGGEIAAMLVVDAVARLLPGTLGSAESARHESFTGSIFDYPVYTRPAEFRGIRVPEVLLSGNHAEIERWRAEKAFAKTTKNRPDLVSSCGTARGGSKEG
jgi:tRNA (guanine37-N1)-methyltransferase